MRRLWGKGKGHFRTRGRYSSGTVRGTVWLTSDRCDGTRTYVKEGVVRVFDFTTKKTIERRRRAQLRRTSGEEAVALRACGVGHHGFGHCARSVACAIAGLVVVLVAQAAPARTAATYTVSIASPGAQPEGNSGSSSFVFTVSISPRVNDPQPVTVDYATSDGSATAGEDYSATSGTLTVTQDAPAQISVEAFGDTKVEGDETFSVNLSNPSANATIGTARARGRS